METLWQDLRYGLRMLLKKPGFTAVAVLTLALGIGANTAMFSVLNTYLFRALPYPESDRLVRVFRTSPHSRSWPHSQGNFFAHHDENDVFDQMAAFNGIRPNLANPGEPAERLQGLAVTADFFSALNVPPQLGRVFTPEEHEAGNNFVAVLSDRFWMSRFGGDPNILERTMRGSTAGRSHHRFRNSLIVGEVAFALVLLTGAGLFLGGLNRFAHLDPGWRVGGLLLAQMSLQGPSYATPQQRAAFVQKLEERLKVLAGVQQAAVSNSLPVFGFNNSGSFKVEGQPEPEPGQWPEVYFESVTSDYFEALGVRLLEGRTFTEAETSDKPDVSIINESMARRFWPNESAIGKRIGRPGGGGRWQEIIGVVNDMSFPARLGDPYTRFQCFRPVAQQAPFGGVSIALRTSVSPEGIASALRGAAADLDPTQPVHRIRSAQSLVDQAMGSISLLGSLLGAFAALGMALAAIGIYGVTSYSVAQRTGEIGIRMALGAQRKHVLWLVLSKGSRTILSGAVLGIGGAYGVSRLLAWLVPELPTRDNLALVGITLVLVGVAMIASYLPARRAAKVDPMIALRYE